MSKSRSMWSLIFLKICDDCMLFRCSLTSWKTCLILISKSTAMTLSNFFENLCSRLSMLFLSIFFAAMMFVIDWRVYDIVFSRRSWIFKSFDWKKNFFRHCFEWFAKSLNTCFRNIFKRRSVHRCFETLNMREKLITMLLWWWIWYNIVER